MKLANDKREAYYKLITTFWSLLKAYGIPENDNYDWVPVVGTCSKLMDTYGDDKFANSFIKAFLNSLEEVQKDVI